MAGFSLYISATGEIQDSALCYKDGPHLPPLNFTTTCIVHGRFVIFYNERLDVEMYPTGYEINNVYTELCEVIVKGEDLLLRFTKYRAYGRYQERRIKIDSIV